MRYKTPQTKEERRNRRRNKAGRNPEPGLGELGQAEAELGPGPSSCLTRPSSPQLGPVRLFPLGCYAIIRPPQSSVQAYSSSILEQPETFRVQQEARQPRGGG